MNERTIAVRRGSALLVLWLVTGCASTRSWAYRPEAPVVRQPVLAKSVVVLPTEDLRTNENTNLRALYLIPLMPYGWMTFDTPEGPERHLTSGVWNFRPPEDIAKVIAQDLQNLGLFKETFFGFRPSDGDLILRSQLHSTRYDAKIISYGLSIEGPLLWLIGFPMGTYSNELRLELRLEDRATGETDSLLKRELRRAFADLQTRLAEQVEAEEKIRGAK